MKTALFSLKPFEREPLERFNHSPGHEIVYFEQKLDADSVHLATGAAAVVVSMHDKVNDSILAGLSKTGVRLVALRCAGFDNVDTVSAAAQNITVMRVPA